MELLKSFTKPIQIGKVRETAKVSISFEYDGNAPDFDYGNSEENAKELARFESGELLNILIVVKAELDGEIGTDCLGQCFIEADNLKAGIEKTVKDHNMVDQALAELKVNILYQANILAKYLVKE